MMTRQEASKIIEQYRMCSSGDCPTLECADCEYNHDPRKVEEAFLMAIDALESAQPEPCEDCVSRRAVLRLLHSGYHRKSMIDEVKELPSAQPEIKPIDYQDCANVVLRMWMDNVVTDGEYNRIMDKLNAFWRAKHE